MPAYMVELSEIVVHTVLVVAKDEDRAIKTANSLVETRQTDLYDTEFCGVYEEEVTEVTDEEIENAQLGI